MANGNKSGGFGWFNPDDRLKQVIGEVATERDLKSLRCSFILLLEHPDVEKKLDAKYGVGTAKTIKEKYNITVKTESQKEQEKHSKLVAQYLALGMSEIKAKELATAFPDKNPLEVVKIRNYTTQNKPIEMKVEKQEQVKQFDTEKKDKEDAVKIEAQPIIEALKPIEDLIAVDFDTDARLVIVKAKKFLGSENFQNVARLVRDLGGAYQSAGKDSYFKIPIPPQNFPQIPPLGKSQ